MSGQLGLDLDGFELRCLWCGRAEHEVLATTAILGRVNE